MSDKTEIEVSTLGNIFGVEIEDKKTLIIHGAPVNQKQATKIAEILFPDSEIYKVKIA